MVPNAGPVIAQWTAHSTARKTRLLLGFIPDYVRIIANHTATSPDVLEWFNKGGQTLPAGQQVPGTTTAPANISQWLDADDHLLVTGTSGIVTRVTTGISAYFGGDVLSADDAVSSNPVHIFDDGTFGKAGLVTPAGIEIPAAVLTNSALYIALCFRRSGGQKVGGLATS